ncbi:MAG: FAD-binding protein [Pseudomonadota bacterium]|nr:MAG: FAD-binding protein [Pseudomonadota bacterium]
MAEPPAAFLDRLGAIAGPGNLLTDPADCWTYGYDNSRRHVPPDVVAFITREEQVRDCVRLCAEFGVPIVARGRGTGTTGSSVPTHAGLVLALERMARIVEMDPANRLMIVEPGVTNALVQERAAQHGFFWPPDPTSSAYCTVGGNIALNAGGPRAVKYGATRDNILGLSAVTGAGEVIHTGTRTTKSAVGFDLTRLLVGSEGTLAIVTQATLKLTPLPEARRTLRAVYRDIRSATQAVVAIMTQSVTPSVLEFIDKSSIDLIRRYARTQEPNGGAHELPSAAGALLIIEVDGMEAAMDTATTAISQAARNDGLLEFASARNNEDNAALWATRKALSPALRTIAPNKLNEDVVVPVSRIPELIDALERLSREYGIPIVNFGHGGNGNIHVNLLYDTQSPTQEQNALPCLSHVFDTVLALGGTLSGEHGIGLAKRQYVDRAIDPATLALMRAIKQQFDPKGILNPGKVFPDR